MGNSQPTATQHAFGDAARVPHSGPKRILVADDDAEMRSLIRDMLQPLGVEIWEASSGVALLSSLREHPGLNLVVTDVRMPWMSGDRIMKMARAAGFNVPVLVTTAFADDELRQTVAMIPESRLLEKPFSAQDLVNEARDMLGLPDPVSRGRGQSPA